MSTVIIRAATAADAPAIWAMLEPVFRAGDTYAIDSGISQDAALAYWLAERAYIATSDDVALGTFYIQENRPGGGAHYCNCGYVTARGSEGRGVARAMLRYSLKEAAALGFMGMVFNFVVASNTRAIGLWQSEGFEIVGRVPKSFSPVGSEDYVDSLVMFRSL